jgi:DNA (cytosine-5)-methyltransferase 1
LLGTDVVPIVSLFSGAGGLDWGFRQQGFVPILALDTKQSAIDTYNWNHPGNVAKRIDLLRMEPDQVVDLVEQCRGLTHASCRNALRPRGIIGGPPCQPFSKGNTRQNPDDARRQLPGRYAQILRAMDARFGLDFFVLENVTGLKSKAHRAYLAELLDQFRDAGFEPVAEELDAARFDVAQVRRRVLVVGFSKRRYAGIQFRFPPGSTPRLRLQDVIGSLPEPVFYSRGCTQQDIPYHPNHWTMQPRSPKFEDGQNNRDIKSRSFRRLKWQELSPTVAYGHREIHVHPGGHRRLSIFEAMLLQGFPKTYVLFGNLSQQVDLVSDAVPPPLASAVAAEVRKALAGSAHFGEHEIQWPEYPSIQTKLFSFEAN